MNWISVKERLPEEDGEYLALFKNGSRKIVWHGIDSDWSEYEMKDYYWHFWFKTKGDYKRWRSIDDEKEPTHWMPLPEPPKE